MRAKKTFVIVSMLCVWTILTYVIFVRKAELPSLNGHHPTNLDQNDLLQRLKLLEVQIKQEAGRHDALVRQLIDLAKEHTPAPAPAPMAIVQSSSSSSSSSSRPIIDFKNVDGIGPAHKLAVGHVERIGQQPPDTRANELSNDVSQIREIALEEQAVVTVALSPEDKVKALLKENIANNHFDGPVIPVLVFACNRVSVRICIENLLQYRKNAGQFPIIVSQVSAIRLISMIRRNYYMYIVF